MEDDGGDLAGMVTLGVDGARVFEGGGARVDRDPEDAVVELGARHGRAVVGQRATGPGEEQLLTEAGRPKPAVGAVSAYPVAKAEPLELGDRPRGESITTGLVTREDGGIREDGVHAEAGGPRCGGRARGAGTDDEYVGVGRQAHGIDSPRVVRMV